MAAPNGSTASTLEQLRHLGQATSTQIARSLGNTAADVVLTRLRKLEASGKVVRVGTVATSGRAAVIWAARQEGETESGAIPANDSDEFIARGGRVEVLPTTWQAPTRYPQFRGYAVQFRGVS